MRLGFVAILFLSVLMNPFSASSRMEPSQANEKRVQTKCKVVTKHEVDLDCSFEAAPHEAAQGPQIWLKRVSLSFEVNDENYLNMRLQLANPGARRFLERRSVYLEINDARGKNYLRRLLPHVDLTSIQPEESRAFDEKLLVAALLPGDYTISLWIPSSQSGQTYDRTQNYLLVGKGIANTDTGLNDLAQLTVLPSSTR